MIRPNGSDPIGIGSADMMGGPAATDRSWDVHITFYIIYYTMVALDGCPDLGPPNRLLPNSSAHGGCILC